MPREARIALGRTVVHVLNRGVGCRRIFDKVADHRRMENGARPVGELGFCGEDHWPERVRPHCQRPQLPLSKKLNGPVFFSRTAIARINRMTGATCRTGILIAAFVLCSVRGVALTEAGENAPVRYSLAPEHPRILLNKHSLREIASRCAEEGPFGLSYKALVHWVDRNPLDPKSPYYPRAYCGPKIALAFLFEKELGRDGSRFLRHIKDVLWKADGEGIDGMDFGWDGIIYDWIYNDLTAEERQIYGNRIGRFLRNYTNTPEITLDGGTYWYNQTWGGMGISWCRDGIAPKTMVALAIAGEKTDFEDDARRWLDSFAKRMPTEFVEKFDRLGGVWPEGPNHGNIIFAPFVTWEAWRSATGQNLFEKVSTTGFHREAPYWPAYATVPHTGQMPHLDDVGPAMFRDTDVSTIRAIHAARFRDGVTQAWTRSAIEKGQAAWADMIEYDPQVSAIPTEKLPTAFHFRGSGHAYMRSGWSGADDTWAVITAAPYFTSYGRGQSGTGTFQISRQGTLAGHGGYQHHTSAGCPGSQNVLLVYDPQERYFGSSGQPSRWNDGGPQIPAIYHVQAPVPRGEILAYEDTDAYTYVGARLTRAYSSVHDDAAIRQATRSEKIREYTRQFVYVRGDPEFFVVYDRVSATKPDYPKTWLLHVQSEPEVLAGGKSAELAAEGPGWKSFTGADGAICRVTSRDGKYWQTSKRGALGVRTLLPRDARITKRGGKGFEVWGNPHDPHASNLHDPEPEFNQSDIDVCLWRIEVEPPDEAEDHRFLHVLVPCGDAEGRPTGELAPLLSAFHLTGDERRDGVRLNWEGTACEIAFDRAGPMGGSVAIRRGEGAPVTILLSSDVKANRVPAGLAISPPRK